MRILHATTHEISGGASIAAMRLHGALLRDNVGSQVAVLDKRGEKTNIILVGGKFSRRIIRPCLLRAEDKLLRMIYPRPRHPGYTTFSLTPSRNHLWLNALPKDILHLHWVGEGFLSPFSLSGLRGPAVWTMHDTFAFTGGCHFTSTGCLRYRERCGNCPEICSNRDTDLSRLHWIWKRRAIERLRPVIVSPSKEYAKRAKESGMLHDCRIEIIPNGLDIDVFRPVPKELARDILGLPQDGRLVLFGAVLATGDCNKGFDLLHDALYGLINLNIHFSALVFGVANPETELPGLAYFLGRLHDPVTLALAYSAADVFVCPSRQENLPNTVMEAMACGTPSVAFSVGGIPDMVEDGITGLLAKPYDTESLARSIGLILQDPNMAARMGNAAREKAVREYSLPVLADRHKSLYASILDTQRNLKPS